MSTVISSLVHHALSVVTPGHIRAHFPALASGTVFLDNAGGSQVPAVVIDRVREYLTNSYVQVGADYAVSQAATDTVRLAHEFVKTLVNAGVGPDAAVGRGVGEVVLGPSTSALCHMLAGAYADSPAAGRDEIVVCTAGHESNVGPWMRLASRGYTVKPWPAVRDAHGAWVISPDTLRPLLSDRTRIVAFPQVSNVLGDIVDAAAVSDLAHRAGARVVCDGVAYAPHRPVDVRAWGVDWYVYSTYKVFGPHMAALFGTRDAFAELAGPNHYFIDKAEIPRKFELGGVNHEGCAGLVALYDYLLSLENLGGAGAPPVSTPSTSSPARSSSFDRAVIESAFDLMAQLELPLQRKLIDNLRSRPDVTIIGPAHGEGSRVATISFVHKSKPAAEIAKLANAKGFGVRYGNFYSVRLCETMGLDPKDGVVRVSLAHYNTIGEIDRLIALFDEILSAE